MCVFGLLTLASGCVSGPPASTAFSSAEYAALPASGTATVVGRAFVTQPGGAVDVASGAEVALTPATSLTDDLFERGVLQERPWSNDPAVAAATRTTTADESGRFRFEGVPAGPHYAVTRVTWTERGGRYGGTRERGEWVATPVAVTGGGEVTVALTR